MRETYVIDGMNVCWWFSQMHPEQVSIRPLITILVALLENDDDFYCVFDASITHTIEKAGKPDGAAAIEELIKRYPEKFYRVTGATRADSSILHDADHNNRKIITNDIYRDYRNKYTWLSDKYTDRLIQGNLQPSGLMTIEKISYGYLSLIADAEKSLERLHQLLLLQNSPQISELDKQIKLKKQNIAELDKIFKEKYEEEERLNKSIIELKTKNTELNRYTSECLSLRKEYNELIIKISIETERLKTLHGVRDFDVLLTGMKNYSDQLKMDISTLESRLAQKKKNFSVFDKVDNKQSELSPFRKILNDLSELRSRPGDEKESA